jgi:hypothetical protein
MPVSGQLPVLDTSRDSLTAFEQEPVTLASMVSSKFSFTWYEATAIVQGVCRALNTPPRAHGAGPLTDASVRIDRKGGISISGVPAPEGPARVREVASILRTLMPDELPVALRLVVSQALAEPPFYDSAESLSKALAYFERPEPTAIIRAAFERWHAVGAHVENKDDGTVAAGPRANAGKPEHRQPLISPRDVAIVAGATAALGFLIAIVFLLWRTPGQERQTEAVSPPVEAQSAPERVVNDAAPKIVQEPARSAEVQRPASLVPPISFATTDASRASAATLPAEPEHKAGPVPISVPPVAEPVVEEPPVVETLSVETRPEIEAPPRIYSASDADVAPPVAVYPQFPSEDTVRQVGAAFIFDVVINDRGAVESVKSRRRPASMADALRLTMTLSAAKTWRFLPAIRDGKSVRYRRAVLVPAN